MHNVPQIVIVQAARSRLFVLLHVPSHDPVAAAAPGSISSHVIAASGAHSTDGVTAKAVQRRSTPCLCARVVFVSIGDAHAAWHRSALVACPTSLCLRCGRAGERDPRGLCPSVFCRCSSAALSTSSSAALLLSAPPGADPAHVVALSSSWLVAGATSSLASLTTAASITAPPPVRDQPRSLYGFQPAIAAIA